MPEQKPIHPCQKCGACCASYRVSFYWREAEVKDSAHPVPQEMCEDVTQNLRAMKGTNQKHNPSCIALQGRVGESVSCQIYQNRSSTCRNFQASYEEGKHRPRCDEARAKHGLKPLRREDWLMLKEDSLRRLDFEKQL